jgi:hypothetical protein
MSTNPTWMATPEPPKKQGSGCKVAGIILGVLFCVCLICCGVGYWGIQRMAGEFEKMVSEDPAVVAEMGSGIAEMNMPDGFKPRMSMDMKIPFVGTPFMKMVVYEGEGGGGVIMLMEFNGAMFSGADREQMMAEMRKSARQQGYNADMEISESKTVDINVRGTLTPFQFAKGKMNHNGELKEMWQVTGVFESKNGTPTMIMIFADAQKFDEQQLVTMLESIR